MTIQEYSKEVLIFSGRLVLPGLGTIRTGKKPAILKGNKLLPPETILFFDPSEAMDDDVLTSKIAAAEEIKPEEARQKVLEMVDDIRFSLDKGDPYEMKGFCTLYRNDDNEIVVEKDMSLILDFDEYGFESFELEGEGDFPGPEPEMPEPESEKVLGSDKPALKNEETIQNEEIREEEQEVQMEEAGEEVRKQSRNTLWFVSGLVVILVAAIAVIKLKTNLLDNGLDFGNFLKEDNLVIDDDFSDSESGEFSFDELVDELEKDIDSSTSVENAMGIREEQEVNHSSDTAGYAEYHIIAGSFRDLSNAEELQKSLTLQGYPSLIIQPGNGIYRVSAISFRDKPTALNRLIEFREKTGMSEAWLMNLE